ncbi:hypothetical protein [Pedosphaera parvula]|uniref:Uncharacterized protein n=1 Tax=Pedosphaera parvula (strain Ellin514) TaxID=320771 RepID=B9XJS8_PEDPL|nr:hypothetical protein [Pedosphaera parvula]EEF59954.1 hypothetical protein Cflav_PD2758 [Pedosphaera parvula Ellin514]
MSKQATSVVITFDGLPLTGQTFKLIDECFGKHGFKPEGDISIYVDKEDEWVRGFTLKDRERILSQGSCIELSYSAQEEPFGWIQPSLDYSPDLLCHKLFFIGSAEFRPAYTKSQRDEAKKIESLSLCLHVTLGSIETHGKSEYQEENWFHFSENVWKEMGELTLIDGEKD